jgi:catechol 2,3-dioxygenase-like lactoylglutathione lyase family enzyme
MSTVEVSGESATGSPPVKPGEMRLELVVVPVSDIDRAKEFYGSLGWRLDADIRGAQVSEVFHEAMPGARFHDSDHLPGPAPDSATYGSFATFNDPDGNGWLLQEITTRLPGR